MIVEEITKEITNLLGGDIGIPRWMAPDFRRIERVMIDVVVGVQGGHVIFRGVRLFPGAIGDGCTSASAFSGSHKVVELEDRHLVAIRSLFRLISIRSEGRNEVCSDGGETIIISGSVLNVSCDDPDISVSARIDFNLKCLGEIS